MSQSVKRIMIVMGTRPEAIKLAPLILAFKKSRFKDRFIVVSTSQHDSLLDTQLRYWNITPDFFLPAPQHEGNLVRLLHHTLSGLQDIIEAVGTIEYIFVQGDTNTALAAANLCFLNQLKLVHIEAGLRSFDNSHPFPEEFNRRVTSLAAYFHFAPSETARQNLLAEGVAASRIEVVGNTVIDALYHSKQHLGESESPKIVLITLHRRENIQANFRILIDIIDTLSDQHSSLKFVWVTHPNCSESIRSEISIKQNIEVLEHMPYDEFIRLYDSAKLAITDSGGITEEAVHLGLPVVIFRAKTERTEAFAVQYPMILSLNKDEIISFFIENLEKKTDISYLYGKGETSAKIVNWLEQEMGNSQYDILIVGGGPAGTGILLKALKDGNNSKLFEQKIALVEQSSSLMKGNLTQFNVNSDTLSDVFLECLEGSTSAFIDTNALKQEIEFVRSFRGKSIPLSSLDRYFETLGNLLKESLESSGRCDFRMNTKVCKVVQLQNHTFEVYTEGADKAILTRQLILTTGGIQHTVADENFRFANEVDLSPFESKIIHSDDFLKQGLPDRLKEDLHQNPKVVILGGSHSAFSAAYTLLNATDAFPIESGGISIWTSQLPKIYFESKADAVAAGYTDFTDEDICPVTNKLYRLAGLRMDGRELYVRMLGLGNGPKENRVTITAYQNQKAEIENDLKRASVIIVAFGYQFHMLPFVNCKGEQIHFAGEKKHHWVNENCELLDGQGNAIPNAYAMGLATGFIPAGTLGGEPSFSGQTNGIWYYQNALAGLISSRLTKESTPVVTQ